MAAVQAAGSYSSPDAVFLPPSRQPGRYGLYVDATPLTGAPPSAAVGLVRFSPAISSDLGRDSSRPCAARFVPLPVKSSSGACGSREATPLSANADDE